ncbi:hypothetical protein HDU91_007135, partial [Kappamyces sp. JEL0680]
MSDQVNLVEDPVTGEKQLTSSEFKKRQKLREKEAQKAAKLAAQPATEAKKSKEEEIEDPQKYFENRSKAVLKLRETKEPNPYPHKFHVSVGIKAFIDKYSGLKEGEHAEEVVTVAGRLHNIRSQSKGLIFYDLHGEGLKIQIMASSQDSERDFAQVHGVLQRGDIVGVKGKPGKSKRGELSIFPSDITLLTPCLRTIPKANYGFKDQEMRYRMRYLDLIMNTNVRDKFIVRAKIINYLRRFLDDLGFLE